MRTNRLYQIKNFFFLMLMMFFASCNNEMEIEGISAPENWDGEIVLSMSQNLSWGASSRSENSRATVEDINTFFQDKCLFMFITSKDKNTNLFDEVIGLKYSDVGFKFGSYSKGENGTLTFTENAGYVPKYPAESGMDMYFVAVSKYSELPVLGENNSLPVINHKISSDQKDSNADSDLLFATVKDQSKTATPIVLDFKHMMSKVSISYIPQEDDYNKVNAVFIENAYNAVNLNMTAETLSTDGIEKGSIRIRTQRTENFDTPQYCEAYVAPTTYNAGNTFVKFCYNYVETDTGNKGAGTSDKVVSYNIPEGKTFEPGHQYKYHMNVNHNGEIVMEDPAIYILGTAIGENGYNLPVIEEQKMTYDETSNEYIWTGIIKTDGDFRFTSQADAYWPGYVKGTNSNDEVIVSYCTEYNGEEPKFTVSQHGKYTIKINRDTKVIDIILEETYNNKYYIVGAYSNWGFVDTQFIYEMGNGVYEGWIYLANTSDYKWKITSDSDFEHAQWPATGDYVSNKRSCYVKLENHIITTANECDSWGVTGAFNNWGNDGTNDTAMEYFNEEGEHILKCNVEFTGDVYNWKLRGDNDPDWKTSLGAYQIAIEGDAEISEDWEGGNLIVTQGAGTYEFKWFFNQRIPKLVVTKIQQ